MAARPLDANHSMKRPSELVCVEPAEPIDGAKKRTSSTSTLVKVISGGETGADMAGLLAAREAGLQTGGTAPPGFATDEGPRPELLKSFGLSPLPPKSSLQAGYVQSSILNVENSDATVAFRVKMSTGTDKTIGFCVAKKWAVSQKFATTHEVWEHDTGHKPVLVVIRMGLVAKAALLRFVEKHKVRILNVAGHREDKSEPGWQKSVQDFLLDVFLQLN